MVAYHSSLFHDSILKNVVHGNSQSRGMGCISASADEHFQVSILLACRSISGLEILEWIEEVFVFPLSTCPSVFLECFDQIIVSDFRQRAGDFSYQRRSDECAIEFSFRVVEIPGRWAIATNCQV